MRTGEYATTPSGREGDARQNPAGIIDLARLAAAAVTENHEVSMLAKLGFAKPLLARLRLITRDNGTAVETELLHCGSVQEDAYYAALARTLRLRFMAGIDPARVVDLAGIDSQLIRPTVLRIEHAKRAPDTAIVPQARRIEEIAAMLDRRPDLRTGLVVTTPFALRRAVWQAGAARRAREVTNGLFERHPKFSARIVLSGAQGFWVGLALTAFLATIILAPEMLVPVMHPLLSYLYLATLLLRSGALLRRRAPPVVLPAIPTGPLPCYTVMVAVYKEAAIAEQLVASLGALDWPPSLIDIKLVCEADDHDTINALRAHLPGPHFEIVEVPAVGPRTKPKALCYALAGARGEFLAIYDAEDRPHPQQLREAHARFRGCGQDIACLQAPLTITNARASWIATLFSLEYAGLFRGLLPMLAKIRMPLPLGGTSNHFRTDILRKAGGWDPYNVTEDADLGMRLFRLGYRAEVLSLETLEDAPTIRRIWMGQRTRWFKGWLQTWLVMMRNPLTLNREIGLPAACIFQLMIGGMLLSSLLHPLIFLFMAHGAISLLAAPAAEIPTMTLVLLLVDTINIFGSYLVFLRLGLSAMSGHEKNDVGRRWLAVPLYWMMTSVAAWLAVLELRSKPFFWNKTPHLPVAVAHAGTGEAI